MKRGLPGSSAGKESTCSTEDPGSIPGPGRSTGEGNSCTLQYSDLENFIDCMGSQRVGHDWATFTSLSLTYTWKKLQDQAIAGYKICPQIPAILVSTPFATWFCCSPYQDRETASPIQSESGLDFPGGSVVKNPPVNEEMWDWSLGQEDPLEKEMATQLQYSCLGNPMDREAWWATVHGVTEESDTT